MLVSDITIIQKKALRVLKYFHKICVDHNLKYSLAYGTLLGAKRHGGFIPWDDDIDIVMPREDVDKLINIIKTNPSDQFGIMDIYDYKNFYAGLMLKLYDKKTTLLEHSDKYNCEYGVFIDIFPVDGVASDECHAKNNFNIYNSVYRKRLHFFKASFHKKNDVRKYLSPIISWFAKNNMVKLRKFFYSVPFNTSEEVIVYPYEPDFQKAKFPKRYFDNLALIPFEDDYFFAFSNDNTNEYLSHYYGDYMTPPPVSQQQAPHDIKVYIEE